jgi:glycopeptide antibiotics resistance protein
MNTNFELSKSRLAYLIAVVVCILLGLGSRTFSHLLLFFFAENAGDVLWAMMVYFVFCFFLVRKSLLTAFCLSLLFSFGIEFSQLYQEEWINPIRGTLLGGLILGKGFLEVDLIRYTIGIMIATIIDKVFLMNKWK